MATSDIFEAFHPVDRRYPDDIGQWPEGPRLACRAALRRLTEKEHPGTKVLEGTAVCIDESHPRFPAGLPPDRKFGLLYTVKLDRAVPVEA